METASCWNGRSPLDERLWGGAVPLPLCTDRIRPGRIVTGFLVQQLVNALTIGAIYALIALGYTMVYGVLRLINFAHSEMFMVGGHVGFFLLAAAASLTGGPAGVLVV